MTIEYVPRQSPIFHPLSHKCFHSPFIAASNTPLQPKTVTFRWFLSCINNIHIFAWKFRWHRSATVFSIPPFLTPSPLHLFPTWVEPSVPAGTPHLHPWLSSEFINTDSISNISIFLKLLYSVKTQHRVLPQFVHIWDRRVQWSELSDGTVLFIKKVLDYSLMECKCHATSKRRK